MVGLFFFEMATKRKPAASSTNMNFRPSGIDPQRGETKGTRPTAKPATVQDILLMVLMHLCKKIIFFDINLKVALYLVSLFVVSLIGDFAPYPRTYFARSDNFFNLYFVKWGWAWTLLISVPYLVLTSFTICCGNREKMLREHLPRMMIATVFWFSWTKSFNFIEAIYGRCNVKHFDTKVGCLKGGHFWNGFDISGHAFILIYSSLVLIEEARSIIGWENIQEYLRNEQYNRTANDDTASTPLRNLSDMDLMQLKILYEKYTPLIRFLFVSMTALQLLWDVMLVSTMLYYHRMVEKILSGIFAVLTWFFCYRVWYTSPSTLPAVVGSGKFTYQKVRPRKSTPLRKPSSSTSVAASASPRSSDVPKFMGMPLYTQRPATE